MKTLLLILFPVLLFGQVKTKEILFIQNYQSATALNGTSQYWTGTNVNNLATIDNSVVIFMRVRSTTGSGTIKMMLDIGITAGLVGTHRIFINQSATGLLGARFAGATAATPAGVTSIADGLYHSIAYVAERGANVTLYRDGAVDGTPVSIAAISDPTAMDRITIGFPAVTASANTYWADQVVYVQIVRFSAVPADIAQIVADVTAKKMPRNSYTNGTIVAWYDWRSGGFDKSGNGNHLTPVASPIIVRVKK